MPGKHFTVNRRRSAVNGGIGTVSGGAKVSGPIIRWRLASGERSMCGSEWGYLDRVKYRVL